MPSSTQSLHGLLCEAGKSLLVFGQSRAKCPGLPQLKHVACACQAGGCGSKCLDPKDCKVCVPAGTLFLQAKSAGDWKCVRVASGDVGVSVLEGTPFWSA